MKKYALRSSMLFIGVLVILLAVLPGAAPQFPLAAHEGGPHVRIAHFAAGIPTADVYANGELIAKGLKYKDVTNYLALEGADFEFVVTPTGGKLQDSVTDKPIKLSFTKEEGSYFTLAAIGSIKDKTFELVKLPADNPAPESASQGDTDHADEHTPGEAASGTIAVTGAYARPTAMKPATSATQPAMGMGAMGSVSAAYMVIKNTGDQPDQLIGVTCDVAGTAETHQTTIKDNVASMSAVPAIDIPAKGSVELKPGSYHIMLMKLKQELTPGQNITLTLTFKSGVKLTLIVPVKPM